MKHSLRLLTLLCTVCFLFSIGGAYATWRFAEEPADPVTGLFAITLKEFTWEGSDILPDDVEGEDHAWLIQNLVHGEQIGLNADGSTINDYIDDRTNGGWGGKRDTFGSMAITGGAEIEAIFGTKAKNLSFLIHMKSSTEYYIYTTDVPLGEAGECNFIGMNTKKGKPNIAIGNWIYPVYKTRITRPSESSEWTIASTERGAAKSAWYEESRYSVNASQIPCFDHTSWQPYTLGDKMNEERAIHTFVGQSPNAYVTDKTQVTYYQLKHATSGTRTITSYSKGCVITVYNQSGTLIATSSLKADAQGQDYMEVSFSASANVPYYIGVTGAFSITFTVS